LAALAAVEEEPAEVEVRGAVQRRIVKLPTLFTEQGMTAGEIAKELDYDEANVYTVLKSLSNSDLLEVIEGASPRRWRFGQKHRTSRVLRLSRLLQSGKWTTYGDFAIAVYDNPRMARAVGQAASKNPAFANPHRVLRRGGIIPPDWEDAEGRGPERCRELLEEDNVRFTPAGLADERDFIDWEALKELLDTDEASADTGDAAA
jgi:alkylated DNA nucleotide flippase Atl1